jgi:hypothetical protein
MLLVVSTRFEIVVFIPTLSNIIFHTESWIHKSIGGTDQMVSPFYSVAMNHTIYLPFSITIVHDTICL